ncbi:MAG: pyridoxal phosphate-dependent aminotransferase family protein [Bacteroidia bacterium]|nr:pyridoxal phosphate-dependent aminotransferase family protein [Bacteroidia bacterium]
MNTDSIYVRYEQELNELASSNNLRRLPSIDNNNGLVNLASNDYLAINENEALLQSFLDTYRIDAHSMSSVSSRLLTGNHIEYRNLECCLDEFLPGRHSLVFTGGFHANQGIMQALMGKNDLIIADKLSHASIIDGLRLTEATTLRYRHNDMAHLERLIEENRSKYQMCMIVTEGIFSMDGDIAPLQQIAELKQKYNALLYVDEAHSFGLRGRDGRGISDELGVLPHVDILMCTLGKAIGSTGAFVSTNKVLREYLVNKCRTIIFTTALAPINCAWTQHVIEHLSDSSMNDARDNLMRMSAKLSSALNGTVGESQIIPYITGDVNLAIEKCKTLLDNGFYALPIRYPTVAKGTERIRLSLKANITESQIDSIISILGAK